MTKLNVTKLKDTKSKRKSAGLLRLANGKLLLREQKCSAYIPYSVFNSPKSIVTKDQLLFSCLKLAGLPWETLDKDYLLHQKEAFNTLIQAIGGEFSYYSHIIRRRETQLPDSEFSIPFSNALNKAWMGQFKSRELFVNDLYFSIIRAGMTDKIDSLLRWLKSLSRKTDTRAFRLILEKHQAELDQTVGRFVNYFNAYNPTVLGMQENESGAVESDLLQLLLYLTSLKWQKVAVPFADLSSYLACRRLHFGRVIEITGEIPDNTRFATILSIDRYPARTYPGILNGLLNVDAEFILSQSFRPMSAARAGGYLRLHQRKMDVAEDDAISLIEEMDEARDDVSAGRLVYGSHHCTIMVHAKSIEELNASVAKVDTALTDIGVVLYREDMAKEACFWAQLPGNFSKIALDSKISSKNFVAMSAFHNSPYGQKDNNHWGQCLSVLETTSSTPYYFNFHKHDSGNTLIFGVSGSGKTTFALFMLDQAVKYNCQRFVFDKDNGCEIYIRACAGSYTIIEPGVKTGLNPFKLPKSDLNEEHLLSLLTLMSEKTLKRDLINTEREQLKRVVQECYELPFEHRRLYHLRRFLPTDSELRAAIESWCGDGSYAWIFDNQEDSVDLEGPINGFEMGNVIEDDIVRSVIFADISYRIKLKLQQGVRTVVFMDELWKYLQDEKVGPKAEDWSRTIRKENGVFIGATQTPNEMFETKHGKAIYQNSIGKIFFPNHDASEYFYTEQLELPDRQFEFIRTTPKEARQFLVKHGPDSVICKFDLSAIKQYIPILSSRKNTVKLCRHLIEQHGSEPETWLPIFIEQVKELDV